MVRHHNGAAETDARHGDPHREYEETREGNDPAGVQELQVDVVRTSDVLKPVTYNRPLQNLLPNCGEGLHSHSCGDSNLRVGATLESLKHRRGRDRNHNYRNEHCRDPGGDHESHGALPGEAHRQAPNPTSPRRLPPETH